MDDGAVTLFLLDNLCQVLLKNRSLLKDAQKEFETLDTGLRPLKDELKDGSINIRKQNATLREINRQITSAIYEIQDAIDKLLLQITNIEKHQSALVRFVKSPVKRLDVSKMVDAILKAVERVSVQQTEKWAPDLEEMIKSPGLSRDRPIVGFEEELERIFSLLRREMGLDVICIVGMPGLGKTTLAYKIFTDPMIETLYGEPHGRIWVNVSREQRTREVLLSILSHFTNVTDDIRQMSDQDISKLIWERLGRMDRFLIVMDGVQSVEEWMALKGAFLKAHKTGKILITTQLEEVTRDSEVARHPKVARDSEVARHPKVARRSEVARDSKVANDWNIIRVPLKLLTLPESWKLLQMEAFVNSICPPELETLGKCIAQKCSGLPLLIIMIGKYLKRGSLWGGMVDKINVWEEVCAHLSSCLNVEDLRNSNTSFYDNLPYHLRPCFLYVGIFPEGFEIPVRTLMELWIAEGFVHKMVGVSLEETALEYLDDLIKRNLIVMGKISYDGHIKTCRVHHMLREFCRKEASGERENVFQEIEYKGQNRFDPSISKVAQYRRLCINSNINNFFSSHPFCPIVHSLVCFSNDYMQPANISFIPKRLRSLRILEAKSITFQMIPTAWSKMALLRYIALSIDFKVIPKVISKLRYLETLIVYTTSPRLEIKANVWKMSRLRHVETNVSTKLPDLKKGKEGRQLETLGMLSHESCTAAVFDRLDSLRKLGICGQLDTLVKAEVLGELSSRLEKLKLVHDLSGGQLQRLPDAFGFPRNLKSLTLSATNLDWWEWKTLEFLQGLEVLKFKDNAFKGDTWVATSIGFSKLQILHIVEHNELVIWVVPFNAFPALKCLVLINCRNLKEIPSRLGNRLRKLFLKGYTEDSSVVASAKRIKEMNRHLLLEIS